MAKVLTGYLEDAGIKNVARAILEGGVVVLPTDTIYGFHCLPSEPEAVERVIALKRKRVLRGLVLLASRISMVDRFVSGWVPEYREKLLSIWPERLTAILPAKDAIVPPVSFESKIAVRIPALKDLRSLIEKVGSPIISTSVNRAGHKPHTCIEEIKSSFPGLQAYISQRGRSSGKPSTLVDLTESPPLVIRNGAYRWR